MRRVLLPNHARLGRKVKADGHPRLMAAVGKQVGASVVVAVPEASQVGKGHAAGKVGEHGAVPYQFVGAARPHASLMDAAHVMLPDWLPGGGQRTGANPAEQVATQGQPVSGATVDDTAKRAEVFADAVLAHASREEPVVEVKHQVRSEAAHGKPPFKAGTLAFQIPLQGAQGGQAVIYRLGPTLSPHLPCLLPCHTHEIMILLALASQTYCKIAILFHNSTILLLITLRTYLNVKLAILAILAENQQRTFAPHSEHVRIWFG